MEVTLDIDNDATLEAAYELGAEEGVPSRFTIEIRQDNDRLALLDNLTGEQITALMQSCQQALQNAANLGG